MITQTVIAQDRSKPREGSARDAGTDEIKEKEVETITQSHPDYTPSQAEEEAVSAIEEAGHDLRAIKAYRDNVGEEYTPLLEWEDWIDEFEEAYQGEMTTREFAEQLADDLGFLDEMARINLAHYFDYERWERDLFMGDYWENDGFIFRSL